MRFPTRLIRGTLVQRYKRFLADVRLESGEIITAHCTNTGSMLGCKEPGSRVYLSRSPNKGRKLAFTWEMIQINRTWVGINTLHPNRLVAEAVEAGAIAEQLQTAAPVVEMLLIRDHSRMKMEAVTPYDSTQEQQFRLLPVAHPADWAAASDEFEAGPIKSEPPE